MVAGSTQGIGFASAQALASLGANCVLIARNEQALQKAVAELDASQGQQHRYLVADFQKPEEVQQQAEKLVADTTVHILVNNSGGPAAGAIVDAKPEAFLQAFNQHLVCNHLLATTVMDSMKKAGYGRIINVISTSVKIPLKGLGVSNTIRGAVASWAKTMANELAPFGITAVSADDFLSSTFELYPAEALAAMRTTRREYKNPPFTPGEFIFDLQKKGLPKLASMLKENIDVL